MSTVTDLLPLTEVVTPEDQAGVAATLREAFASQTAVYPLGGGTSLDYGLSARQSGWGLSLANLTKIVDYPARDMTITVEAGITMAQLAEVLASERQWLPIDVPQTDRATLGGVVATAFNGPRRYGWGTIRDYVIGITAVDGRGMTFHGGGRVVKNVAGYDFCKLLTGSLGTLGVITQLTLKIKPQPERSALLTCAVDNPDTAETLLSGLVHTRTAPAAIELLLGPAWEGDAALGPASSAAARLIVGLEGTDVEVEWMLQQLAAEWREAGVASSQAITGDAAAALWKRLAEFPAAESEAPLVLKANVAPSGVLRFVQQVQQVDQRASFQAHAGNGIVIARLSAFQPADVSRQLIGRLQPAARAAGGGLVVLSSTLGDLTRQAVWGGVDGATSWMTRVKQQFDPQGLLNPGRFVYGNL